MQRVPRGCWPSHSLRSRAAEGRLTTVETMLLLVVLLRKAATKSFSEEKLRAGSGQSRWVPAGFSPRREGRGRAAARPLPWGAGGTAPLAGHRRGCPDTSGPGRALPPGRGRRSHLGASRALCGRSSRSAHGSSPLSEE